MRGPFDRKKLDGRLAAKGLKAGAPIFIRIFKKESQLELWMLRGEKFVLFDSYAICTWSGRLGPKLKEGDWQSPEGFYTVARGQLNPNSRYRRSFNLGFPNIFDRAHKRTGSFLMVHGGCSSIGCYAMTDPVIDEIWHLVTKAFDGGQARFAVHAFPFRMTRFNMTLYAGHKWAAFWSDLKRGYDMFELLSVPPQVSVCKGRYEVRPAGTNPASAPLLSKDCRPLRAS